MTKNYIADHWSVLKVKLENGMNVKEEFELFDKHVQDIDQSLLNQLYVINKKMFPIHDAMMKEQKLEMVGKMARYLLELNGERVRVRSRIAKTFNEFEEYKTYA